MVRKTIKHRQYSIEEKNEIVSKYLSGKTSGLRILSKELDVSHSVIRRWIIQYREFGTTVDRRGKETKKDNPKIGRPKKTAKIEDMTKEELIEHINMLEDIKKAFAYLDQQKKNTKQ